MTGYQIQNKNDRTNAFADDRTQVFETLEEARAWSDEIYNSSKEASPEVEKDDFIIAYYENGVQRGEYPLFE